MISRSGVGSDAIVLDDATRHRVVVTITPGTNHDAVVVYDRAGYNRAPCPLCAALERIDDLEKEITKIEDVSAGYEERPKVLLAAEHGGGSRYRGEYREPIAFAVDCEQVYREQ